MRATLIVHTNSMTYVRRLVEFLHDALSVQFGDAEVEVVNDIAEAKAEAPLVLVIGEGFGRFTRRPGTRYVYINLSVVAGLGNPLATSRQGWRQLRYKRRLLDAKLDLFDAMLDYYPPQTRLVARRLAKPVYGFLPAVVPHAAPPALMVDRPYDICFIGTMTPRRTAVLDALRTRGLTLSPTSGVDLEEAAGNARLVLNVHMNRSNHLEIPRVVGALSAGSAVLSERSHGLDEVLGGSGVIEVPLRAVVSRAAALVADEGGLQQRAASSSRWYRDVYLPRARSLLAQSLASICEGHGPAAQDGALAHAGR